MSWVQTVVYSVGGVVSEKGLMELKEHCFLLCSAPLLMDGGDTVCFF